MTPIWGVACADNPGSGPECLDDIDCGGGFTCRSGSCFPLAETCVDRDGDGFFTGVCEGGDIPDCNDDDASINPGAVDAPPMGCDEIDNNCMNGPDDGCACPDGATEVPCGGQGACAGAIRDCIDGRWTACLVDGAPAPTPTSEVCGDGIDNDCNGEIDNGCNPCADAERPDMMGNEELCPDDGSGLVTCSSNGICL